MNNIEPERLGVFLEGLSALTVKHQISIHGCGCCESPYLVDEILGTKGKYLTGGGADNLTFCEE